MPDCGGPQLSVQELELEMSRPLVREAVIKTLKGSVLVKQFLLRSGLVKNRTLWRITKGVLLLSPHTGMGGLFSDIHRGETGRAPAGKGTKMPEFSWGFKLSVACSEPPAIHQVQFLPGSWFPQTVLRRNFYSGTMQFSVSACLSLHFSGPWFVL